MKKTFRLGFWLGSGGLGFCGWAWYKSALSIEEYEEKKARKLGDDIDKSEKGKINDFGIGVGDLVYMKHNCSKGFSINSIRKCYVHKMYKWWAIKKGRKEDYHISDYDSVGVVVWTTEGPQVLFQFFNTYTVLPVSEFLCLPYISELSISKLATSSLDLKNNSEKFLLKVQHIEQVIQNSWPKRSKCLFRDGVDIVLNYWAFSGMANIEDIRRRLRITVFDLEISSDKFINKSSGQYSSLIKLQNK